MQIVHNTITGALTFGPAFNLDFLLDILKLQQSIEAIGQADDNGLEKHCFAPMTFVGEQPIVSQCVAQSVLGYFQNSEEFLKKSTVEPAFNYTINYLNHLNICLK